MMAAELSYRQLMRKVEGVINAIVRGDEETFPIHAVANQIICEFRAELGIYGGRLYEREGDFYTLKATFPDAVEVKNIKIPRTYPPIELCLMRGTIYMEVDDPRIDKELEAALGVLGFAGVEIGSEQYVLGFNVEPGHDRDQILSSLSVIRHAINQKLHRDRLEEILRQARHIQLSIQPRRPPEFGDYDISGRIETMESVGGDYFDYIPITDKILGLAIADVTGHGLPAALQVRDIYTGLRMGLGRDFKIVRTVERLNGIIHESTLTRRFVSMVYGELERNGTLIYVNAGHPPPFHLNAAGEVAFLDQGGPVLGPLKGATYNRGFVRLQPGDLVVAYTDGITEAPRVAESPNPEEYGLARLLAVARAQRSKPAAEVVAAIFADVDSWTNGAPLGDDRTVVALVYPE